MQSEYELLITQKHVQKALLPRTSTCGKRVWFQILVFASEFESNQWNCKAAFIGILWSERIHVSILRIGVMQVPSWTYGLVRVVSWRCFPTARSPSCTCTVLIVVIRPYALKVGFTELPQNIQTSLNISFVLFLHVLQIHLVQWMHF